ncbi:Transport and Golgi organization protein 6 [Nymphon striatum]|nr:Transport and Golgi organization protein 6 [Nymphon striatum]
MSTTNRLGSKVYNLHTLPMRGGAIHGQAARNVQELTDCLKASIASFRSYLLQNKVVIDDLKSEILTSDEFPNADENNSSWCYVFQCLRIICSLCTVLTDSSKQGSVCLNVNQQKQVLNCVQFIIVIGISPSLIPGVGLSMKKRTAFANFVQVFHDNNSVWSKHNRLVLCIEILFQCLENQHFCSIVLSRYLIDLLSALFQLCYAPLKKPESDVEGGMTVTKYNELMTQRQTFCEMLDSLCLKTYPPALVQSLITLQSATLSGQTKTPKWLKNVCGELLTKILLMKNGFQSVIQGFLIDNSSSSNAPEWKMCETVAQLISSIPKNLTAEEYLSNISSQILTIMSSTSDHSSTMNRFFGIIIHKFLMTHPELTKEFFLQQITNSFLKLNEQNAEIGSEDVVLSSIEMTSSIHHLNCLCMIPGELCLVIMELISNVYPVLFAIYSYAESVGSILKKLLSEIIVKFLQSQNIENVITLMSESVFMEKNRYKTIKFALDDDHGIIVHPNNCVRDESEWIEIEERHVNAIMSILTEISNESIQTKFFLHLLQVFFFYISLTLSMQKIDYLNSVPQNLSNVLNDEKENTNYTMNEHSLLLEIENRQNEQVHKLRNNLVLLNLVIEMVDKFGSSLLKEKHEIIKFSCCTLERGAHLCSGNSVNVIMMEAETITMAMSILTTLLTECNQLTINEKSEILESVKSLEILSSKHPKEHVKLMSQELKTTLSMFRSEWFPKQTTFSNKDIQNSINKKLAACEKRQDEKSEFEKAWHDLSDPLLPVRGHGLLALANLISAKDSQTLQNKQKIRIIFQENLSNEDSYIYLAAIQGLVALCNIYPDEVIHHLTSEFVELESDERSVEVKMKVGEALVKASRNIGQLMPKYRDILLNAFFTGLKSSVAHIRASCLSNIGEICKLLCFSLGPRLQELLLCLRCAISETEECEVRRAAVLVITLIFQGCGVHTLKVLEQDIKDIYRVLKFIHQIDKDDVVRLHAQVALEELNKIMKQMMFPNQNLVKEIKIL